MGASGIEEKVKGSKTSGALTDEFYKNLRAAAARAASNGIEDDDGGRITVKNLADFRNTYDKSFIVPKKIKTALKGLGKGWLYEMDFAREAGISLKDLHAYREQFEAHIVLIPKGKKRVWAGTPELAKQMVDMIS